MKVFLIFIISSFFASSFALTGYVSYHLYSPSTPLTQCACSDGQNGLITRWGINDLSSLFPYVSAFSNCQWNSPYIVETVYN